MKFSVDELVSRTLQRDHRAIARMISNLENGDAAVALSVASLRRKSGRAHVIGITGAPGAGKSTLVDALVRRYRTAVKLVAVIAVDPSSPFSGGAILGDRIRMNLAAEDPSIFIRSMATRGSLGGLAQATLEAVHVLDCAGFDCIVVETVGVGQAEVDIVRAADTCLVVLVPGMGDSVQIIKAGLMEIADVFVVNKADREGALALEKDLYSLLALEHLAPEEWKPKVLKTVGTNEQGIEELFEAGVAHSTWLRDTARGLDRRLSVITHTLETLIGERVKREALRDKGLILRARAQECLEGKLSIFEAVNAFLVALSVK